MKTKRLNDVLVSTNFKLFEFECHHCHVVMISPEVIDKTQAMRTILNAPVYIGSGYRCVYWNSHEGGVETSQHPYGYAVDLISPGVKLSVLEALAWTVGFKEVISNEKKGYVHCGLYPTLPEGAKDV